MTIVTTGGAELTAQAHRNQTSLTLLPGLDPLKAVDGVHSGLDLAKTSGMSFSISTGRAAINAAAGEDGAFAVTVTSPEVAEFAPGDSTRDRVDLVVLRTDATQGASGAAYLDVLQGAYPASGLPVPPAVPAGSLPLWRVPIAAGTSAGAGGWNRSKAVDVRPTIGFTRWNTFVPVWSNFASLGTGYQTRGRWRRNGDQVAVQAFLIGGTGAKFGTKTPAMTLPVSRDADAFRSLGTAMLRDGGPGFLYRDVRCIVSTQTTMDLFSADYGWLTGAGSIPFGKDSQINVDLTYNVNESSLG